jgi:hypothetical protein
MEAESFEEVWKVAKNCYHKAYDAPFQRFMLNFCSHRPACKFHPAGIQPWDLVGFLRREREHGATHPSLKDAASLEQLKCKLVILLMVDTAARSSDIWRLFSTTVGKYGQTEWRLEC